MGRRAWVSIERLRVWPSVQFIGSVVSNSLWPHGLQHARLPCPSLSCVVCSNSCPLSGWCLQLGLDKWGVSSCRRRSQSAACPTLLSAVLTAPPLPSSSSSLPCPPWGPDWGEEVQKGDNRVPLCISLLEHKHLVHPIFSSLLQTAPGAL